MRTLLRTLHERWGRADARPTGTQVLTVALPQDALRSPQGIAALHDADLPGPLLHWGPPAGSDGELAVAGRGEAIRVCASGPHALAEIRTLADRHFRELSEERAPGCAAAPPPRFYGGLRFSPGVTAELEPVSVSGDDPWRGFPDAAFALPRWLLLQRGNELYLQLAAPAAELADPTELAEIGRELAAIDAAIGSPAPRTAAPPPLRGLHELPAERFCGLVDTALDAIARGELVKVVTARRSLLEAERPFAPGAVLARLDATYPACQRFAVEQHQAVFLGATPELLAQRRGRMVTTEALAGTRPAGADADKGSPESLFRDDKEQREHAHVIAAIVEALAPLCQDAPACAATFLRSLPNVHHLCTPIRAALRDDTHVLDIVARLHPTPAVCGLPQERARRFIASHEPVSRGMYAAPVGWFDGSGDGRFAVAIRSALLRGSQAWLYAGAGIVAGSDARREYLETAAKQRAMLGALGMERQA